MAASGGGKLPKGGVSLHSVWMGTKSWILSGSRLLYRAKIPFVSLPHGLEGRVQGCIPVVLICPVCLAQWLLCHSLSHINLEWDVGTEDIFTSILLAD